MNLSNRKLSHLSGEDLYTRDIVIKSPYVDGVIICFHFSGENLGGAIQFL